MTSPRGDQNAVLAFLGDPATYGRVDPVERIETHAAIVFLAGPDVYKVKRAVRYAYLDFSTLEKRKAACEAEIAVNRSNAPSLYLNVVPVTRSGEGLRLGGDGSAVEWLVHMRRFDERATLDHVVERGELGAELADRIAGAVIAAHARAPVRDGQAAVAALEKAADDCLGELRAGSDLFPSSRCDALAARLKAAFARCADVLRSRAMRGQVRRCHGDLHLRNIAIVEHRPVLFDAIEFDERIATTDTLYDLAFLVMDLCEHGLAGQANRILNRYLWMSADERLQIEGLAAMPAFLSLRAAIRANVLAAQFRLSPAKTGLRREAGRYLEAASGFLDVVPPRLVAVGGLSGTGKSTLAAAVSSAFGARPGAVHLRSDIERKRMFKAPETERLPAEAYRAEISNRVYEELAALAGAALTAGRSVIVDATWRDARARRAIAHIAARTKVPFVGLWLDAPPDVIAGRLRRRRNDASDATPDVASAQARHDIGAIDWQRLDSSTGFDILRTAALRAFT